MLRRQMKLDPDTLLLHESPDLPEKGFIGNAVIREVLIEGGEQTVVCGHCFWEEPLVELGGSCTVLNVDSKVVVLERV